MVAVAAEFQIPVTLQLSDGVRERVQAQILRVSTGFMVLSSPLAIEPGRTLNVLYLDRHIRCESAYCVRQPIGTYRVGLRMLEGTEGALRAERRIRLNVSGQLSTPRLAAPLSVYVIDMSSSGLGVKLEVSLTVGDPGYVELEHGVAFGEIRHCEKTPGGYRAGLFIEEFISRNAGTLSPWAAYGGGIAERTATSSVARALRTALSPHKRF